MFERFTRDARVAVIDAQAEAVEQDAIEIDTTHLLFGLLGPVEGLLADLGVRPELLREEVAKVRRRGGITDTDAAALGELGIDVEQIVDRVEQVHGANALAGRAVEPKRRRWFGQRAHRPFTTEAKHALEQSLREALELSDRHIGPEHLLLALATRPGPVADVLAAYGADHLTLRRALTRRQVG
ncbi:Clp protease N-terminal domain-containing protein [Amycolatopsis cihanbeyliensis]|uniref:ClpA/ClpB-like protein n=1 Tax=Amycolatopsis cihanbeyliensis TaxID=1128664 RepID=A0A542DJX4_AMYCI|nr:Clp protease N-terminal domain-containing protein [Amycolatopsis cihanbeyliensis]TQJ03402.1 ClpA/ClpB-like protein [Amycolatopsis cihanbeyliensis]